MMFIAPFKELKACPTRSGPYRPPQIPGEPPMSLGSTRAQHHHTEEVLPRRKVDQPKVREKVRGGYADDRSEQLLEALRSDRRQWTARELAEKVFGDAAKAKGVAAILMRMRMRGECESAGTSGAGHAVTWYAV